jgi:hypothetical protein
MVEGRFTSRQFLYHASFTEKAGEGLTTVSHWFVPSRWNGPWQGLLVLVGLLGPGSWISRSQRITREARFQLKLVILVMVLFIIFLVVSVSLFDVAIPFDGRILAPAYLLALIALSHILNQFFTPRRHFLRVVFLIFVIMFAFFFARRGISHAVDIRGGQGYVSESWQNSPTIRRLRQIDPQIPIYSNGYDVIYLYTRKPTKWLPEPSENDSELHRLENAVRGGSSLFVFLDQLDRPSLLENQIVRRIPMRQIADLPDGRIYVKD